MIRIKYSFGLGIEPPCPEGSIKKETPGACEAPSVWEDLPGRYDCKTCSCPPGTIRKGIPAICSGTFVDAPGRSDCRVCKLDSVPASGCSKVYPTNCVAPASPRMDGNGCWSCSTGSGVAPCPPGSNFWGNNHSHNCGAYSEGVAVPNRSDCFTCVPKPFQSSIPDAPVAPVPCPAGWIKQELAVDACPEGQVRVFSNGCSRCQPGSNCFLPGQTPVNCPAPFVLANRGNYVCCVRSAIPPGMPTPIPLPIPAPVVPSQAEVASSPNVLSPMAVGLGVIGVAALIYFSRKGK